MPNKSLEDSTKVNVLVVESNGISNDNICEDLTQDGNDESSASIASSNSSPERLNPFETRFDVFLGKSVSKNGNIVLISIESIRAEDEQKFSVLRQYEDFEYLHHCLTTAHKTDGLIIPPL